MKSVKTILSLLVLIPLFACEKENTPQPPISIESMYSCHQLNSWTPEMTTDALIGKWQWVYFESFWSPNKGQYTEDQELYLHFTSDSTLYIIEQKDTTHTSKWKVITKDQSLYALKLTEPHPYLHGRLLLCENFLLFNNSYVDGTDNYFKQIR
ncbi:MAG: hypothetical protein ACQESW_11240 [Bacteroidota bacterium]